ncbi:unnamed protein product, partial [Ectocarpus sp. 13 AM-2016]
FQVLEREFAKPAMELIKVTGPKGENQRYAGALVLRELAENAPAVMYDRRGTFFETIWLVVNDLTSAAVRVRAAAALGAMLRLVHERQSTPKHSRLVLDKIEEGFEQGTAERVHGSLLVIRQLLRHPGPWMAHRHRRRRRRRRGSTEDNNPGPYYGGGGSGGATSGTATPFGGGAVTPLGGGGGGGAATPVTNNNSSGVRLAPQMLPPPARGTGGGGGSGGDLSKMFAGAATPVGAPSTAGSGGGGGGGNAAGGGPSTAQSQKGRGAFFPEGGGSVAATAAARGVVPPPPSPHNHNYQVLGMLGGGAAGAGAAAAAAAAAAAMAEAGQEAEYRVLCEKVLARRDHKEVAVRRTVMALLAELVAFFPGGAGEFVEPAVWFLIHTLRQGQRSDRGLAYLSLARLGLAAGTGVWRGAPTLWHSVREVVKEGLAEDRRDFCPQSLACLEMIVIIGSASAATDAAAAAQLGGEGGAAAAAAAAAAGRISPTPHLLSAPTSPRPMTGNKSSPSTSSETGLLVPQDTSVVVGVVMDSEGEVLLSNVSEDDR